MRVAALYTQTPSTDTWESQSRASVPCVSWLTRRHTAPTAVSIAPRLYGVLCIYQQMGRDEAADRLGVTRNALSRLLAQVRDAGIATAITDTAHELPPLQVTFPQPPKTCIQTPGVTQGSLASEEASDQ